jgi:hypothetical protein
MNAIYFGADRFYEGEWVGADPEPLDGWRALGEYEDAVDALLAKRGFVRDSDVEFWLDQGAEPAACAKELIEQGLVEVGARPAR